MKSRGQALQNSESDSGDLSPFRATIAGIGAIGTNAAEFLTKANVGSLTIIDRDFVESKNLDNQRLYSSQNVGMPKAIAAKARLKNVPGKTKITAKVLDLDNKNVSVLADADVVLDCTDNFETRFLINDFCRKYGIPWIHAAAIRNVGNAYCITPDAPCFRCIFNNRAGPETCDTAGVDNAVVAKIAIMQARQAIRIMLGKPHEKRIIRISPLGVLKLKVSKNKNCETCKGNYEHLSGRKPGIVRLCGTDSYQIRGRPVNLRELKKKLKGLNPVNFGYCLHSERITVFKDGRAFVKAESPERAKAVYRKLVGRNQLFAL